jgi:release factor glutamine methyltransferase
VVETRGSLVAEVAGALLSAGFEEPRRHARRLVAAALAISRADLFSHPDQLLDEQQVGRVRMMLGRMVEREPLSRILGRREFWGLEFALSSETLDPRSETETIVEAVLRRKPDRGAPLRVLDLGTGTGCLLLALLSEFPCSKGLGIDIAEVAIRTAARNALTLGFAGRALFVVGDWTAAISANFDAIVSNPPYIASDDLWLLPREVALHDPRRALDGGTDGLGAYRVIAKHLPMLLAADGIFVTEIGVDQGDAVSGVMRTNGLVLDGIEKDLAGIPRCVIARPRR